MFIGSAVYVLVIFSPMNLRMPLKSDEYESDKNGLIFALVCSSHEIIWLSLVEIIIKLTLLIFKILSKISCGIAKGSF